MLGRVMAPPTRRRAAALLGLALVSGACGSTGTGSVSLSGVPSTLPGEAPATTVAAAPATTQPSPATTTSTTLATVQLVDVELTAGLIPFTACQDLLAYLRAEAMERVGPYGLEGGGWYGGPVALEARAEMAGGMEMEMAMPMMGDDAFAAPAPMVAGVDYSGTNVQELGIDEPDLVKTDGRRMVVVEGSSLHHIDLTGPEAVLTDSLDLEGHWSSDMLLAGDRLLVLAGTDAPYEPYGPVLREDSGADRESALARLVPPGTWKQLASVIEVDLSDPANLAVANTLTVEGGYVSARVVNGSARVVFTSGMEDLPFVYPSNPAGEERAEAANREVIADTTIDDWVPRYVHESADGTVSEGHLVRCADMSHPVEFSGFSTLSVLTVDLAGPLGDPDAVGVLSDGQTVYAGSEHLYVATNRHVGPEEGPWNEEGFDYSTSIHQFAVTDPTTTTYTASGTVDGHLLNQFSMSEHEGHLRVATTLGSPWWSDEGSESLVTVLTRTDDELARVGQVGDMGRGERIYAVRFMGDVGYVVTFRRTDPFYTLDLSDPTAPAVRGELKITGYSGYLHPVGEGLILGIGQEATDEGRTTGAKATLFDVSDLSAPAALDSWNPGGGSTSVEWDHRAFLWWEPEQLAVMPFSDWRNDANAAVVLRITDGAISEVGRIEHAPDLSDAPDEFPCPVIDPEVLGAGLEAELLRYVPGDITLILCPGDEPVEPMSLEAASSAGSEPAIGTEVEAEAWASVAVAPEMEPVPGPDFDSWEEPAGRVYPEVAGHFCEYLDAEDVAEFGMEFGIEPLAVPEGATVGACFPDDWGWMPPIQRTLVVGDRLWSYSWGQVQANDLATLERLQAVRFPTAY